MRFIMIAYEKQLPVQFSIRIKFKQILNAKTCICLNNIKQYQQTCINLDCMFIFYII